jgi:hypothetical protein
LSDGSTAGDKGSLQRMSASYASLLLNAEAVFTVGLAALIYPHQRQLLRKGEFAYVIKLGPRLARMSGPPVRGSDRAIKGVASQEMSRR